MLRREKEFQKIALKFLEIHQIYPFSCIFTYAIKSSDGILGLTFYIPEDLLETLRLLDYKSQCDKSGYIIIEGSNTLLLEGLALFEFYEIAKSI